MQPFFSISAPVAALLWVNGRYAGETAPDAPLTLPVSAWGPFFLSLQPLEPGYLPLARRLTLSGGRALPESLAADVWAAEWPGGVTELELTPARLGAPAEARRFSEQGTEWAVVSGPAPRLEVNGRAISLPEGASLPALRREGAWALFAGEGYLAAVAETGEQHLIVGRDIEIEGPIVRALAALEDTVGHARLETWHLGETGAVLESAEPVWAEGGPRWPRTAEDTVLAALEAAFLGLTGEAEGYLSPQLHGRGALAALAADFDACAPLKYAPPGARNAVGLLKAEGENFVRVTPLFYRASPLGGAQGPWRVDALER